VPGPLQRQRREAGAASTQPAAAAASLQGARRSASFRLLGPAALAGRVRLSASAPLPPQCSARPVPGPVERTQCSRGWQGYGIEICEPCRQGGACGSAAGTVAQCMLLASSQAGVLSLAHDDRCDGSWRAVSAQRARCWQGAAPCTPGRLRSRLPLRASRPSCARSTPGPAHTPAHLLLGGGWLVAGGWRVAAWLTGSIWRPAGFPAGQLPS
jgi:hypothetical protein